MKETDRDKDDDFVRLRALAEAALKTGIVFVFVKGCIIVWAKRQGRLEQ